MWYSENERKYFISCSYTSYFFKLLGEIGLLTSFIACFFSLFHIFRCYLGQREIQQYVGLLLIWLIVAAVSFLLVQFSWVWIAKKGFRFNYQLDQPEMPSDKGFAEES